MNAWRADTALFLGALIVGASLTALVEHRERIEESRSAPTRQAEGDDTPSVDSWAQLARDTEVELTGARRALERTEDIRDPLVDVNGQPLPFPHPEGQRTGVVVLGMHRSGTSTVTGLLHQLGLNLGDMQMVGAGRSNAKGHGELVLVTRANDLLLTGEVTPVCNLLECWKVELRRGLDSLSDPSKLAPGPRRLFHNVATAVVENLNRRPPWVLKDPRMALTFEYWKPHLGDGTVVVIVSRDPMDVACSLKKRNRMPIAYGLALWETHVVSLLRLSAGWPRLLVSYDKLMADPPKQIQALHAGLSQLNVPLPDLDFDAVKGWLDPRLSHGCDATVRGGHTVSPFMAQLHAAMEDGTALEWTADEVDLSPETKAFWEDCNGRQTCGAM